MAQMPIDIIFALNHKLSNIIKNHIRNVFISLPINISYRSAEPVYFRLISIMERKPLLYNDESSVLLF